LESRYGAIKLMIADNQGVRSVRRRERLAGSRRDEILWWSQPLGSFLRWRRSS